MCNVLGQAGLGVAKDHERSPTRRRVRIRRNRGPRMCLGRGGKRVTVSKTPERGSVRASEESQKGGSSWERSGEEHPGYRKS